MVGDPGVEEKDEGPDDESSDDGILADAFTRQAELKNDGDGEIEKEEPVVGRIAIETKGNSEPHRHPRKNLPKD
jgi:hypothetical protein